MFLLNKRVATRRQRTSEDLQYKMFLLNIEEETADNDTQRFTIQNVPIKS